MQGKIPVIAIVGPTASGKTALGVSVAKALSGEVVSADSMQVYNSMPIASAAPTVEEMMGIPHHLVGFAKPTEKFSVAEFIKLATAKVEDIHSRGKMPIIVGGTGLYIDSFLEGVTFNDEDCTEIREKLEREAEVLGMDAMLQRLYSVDPKTAEKLHVNDRKRVLRALEVYKLHGKTLTELNEESKLGGSKYEPIYIGITYKDREKLYERINKRVDLMLQNGLVEEANRAFLEGVGNTAVQAIGHKELFPYFNGECTLDEAVDSLKTATRHYAKRQLTWFRRNDKINWIYADVTIDVVDEALRIITKILGR